MAEQGRITRSSSQPDALLSELKALKNAIETSKNEVIKTLRADIDNSKGTIKFLSNRVDELEQKNIDLQAKCAQLSSAPFDQAQEIIDE